MNTDNGTRRKVKGLRTELNLWENDSGNNRIYEIDRTFENLYKRLVSGQPKENVKLYNDFLKRMKFEGIGIVRRVNYLRSLCLLKEITGKRPIAKLGKKDTDAFLDRISSAKAGTIQIRFYCLKKFLKFIGKGELVKGVKPPKTKDVKVKASDLLTREEVERMLKVVGTVRGKAFISMLYESGARIGELLNLKIKDLEFDEHGVKVSLEGKTGLRVIRLVESVSYLREWIDLLKKTKDTPYLWFGADEREPSKYEAFLKFLKVTARKSGIEKNVYPHLFRHSRASELAQKLK